MGRELQRTKPQYISMYDDEIFFYKKINENLSESVRFVAKEYRRLKNMEYMMIRIMMLIIGVLILAIGTFMDMFSNIGFILYVTGSCLLLATIFSMIRDWRKRMKAEET